MKITIKEYFEGLSPELRKEVALLMVEHHLKGGVHTNTDPADECSCRHDTPNGHCTKINGVCTWIPDLG